MGTTLAILSSSGKMPSFIEEFIRCVSGFIKKYKKYKNIGLCKSRYSEVFTVPI